MNFPSIPIDGSITHRALYRGHHGRRLQRQTHLKPAQPERTLHTRTEKRLLIIRNLQSEKTIVNKQQEFYLSEGKFSSEEEIFPYQQEFSFKSEGIFLPTSKTLPVY
jgi:hypothetical protein